MERAGEARSAAECDLGSRDDLKAAHAALAAESTNARHTVVPDAGHEIHLFQPKAVIQAIQAVVAAARNGTRLPPRD